MTEIKNDFHIRIYDAETVKSINELITTKRFSSVNELMNKAINIGIEKIYLDFGKKKALGKTYAPPEETDSQRIDNIDHKLNKLRLTMEDILILLNAVELLTASNFNLYKAALLGEPVSEELIDSGHYAEPPEAYVRLKEQIAQRYSRQFKREEKK